MIGGALVRKGAVQIGSPGSLPQILPESELNFYDQVVSVEARLPGQRADGFVVGNSLHKHGGEIVLFKHAAGIFVAQVVKPEVP